MTYAELIGLLDLDAERLGRLSISMPKYSERLFIGDWRSFALCYRTHEPIYSRAGEEMRVDLRRLELVEYKEGDVYVWRFASQKELFQALVAAAAFYARYDPSILQEIRTFCREKLALVERTRLLMECASVSSGTLAALSGEKDLKRLDMLQNALLAYVQENWRPEWQNWVDVWRDFTKTKSKSEMEL